MSLSAPTDSSVLDGIVEILIQAGDDDEVVRVAAYAGDDSLGEDESAPYAIPFDPGADRADTLMLSASAWDAAGNRGDSPAITVFTQVPLLAIEIPAAGDVRMSS